MATFIEFHRGVNKDMQAKDGVLLINLGTPESPEPFHVRSYLRQFLSDPRVIDLPRFFRWLLVYCIILPFRTSQSSRAYIKIWNLASNFGLSYKGFPLKYYLKSLEEKLQRYFGDDSSVVIRSAFRYGEPSIEFVLREMTKSPLRRLLIVPLYPQYASSSTGSSLEEVFRCLKKKEYIQNIQVLPAFFQEDFFIEALDRVAQDYFKTQPQVDFIKDPDVHFFFSFHGLPERHILKACSESGQSGCLKNECCCDVDTCRVSDEQRSSHEQRLLFCYRAQCYQTARALATKWKVPSSRIHVGFQSRLGRTPWIRPYSDLEVPRLVQQGVKKMVFISPSFVADCLETLEELGIRMKKSYLQSGGQEFFLLPCLNDHDAWVNALGRHIKTLQSRR